MEVFSSLTKLRKLQLFKNKLTDLPIDCIASLTNLQLLTLSSNNIKSIPEELGHLCTDMREIYISNNPKLASLPESLGSMPQLRTMSAARCTVKNLPDSLGSLPNIQHIDLRTLKKAVCKMTPEVANELQSRQCLVQGVVVKKAKKKSKGTGMKKKK
jgi:Leucine-rich repeat (LRR) protein